MIDSPVLNLIQSVNCPQPTLVSAAIWKHESTEKFRLLNLWDDKHEPTWREIPVSWTWITYAVSLPFMLSRGTGFHDKSTLCSSIVAESTVGDADGTGIIQKDEHWQWKSHVVTSYCRPDQHLVFHDLFLGAFENCPWMVKPVSNNYRFLLFSFCLFLLVVHWPW